jgi:hypothetical protein
MGALASGRTGGIGGIGGTGAWRPAAAAIAAAIASSGAMSAIVHEGKWIRKVLRNQVVRISLWNWESLGLLDVTRAGLD